MHYRSVSFVTKQCWGCHQPGAPLNTSEGNAGLLAADSLVLEKVRG
jgi:mono/diheme cytochrome c family protein